MLEQKEALRQLIIERLIRKRMWGGKHTEHLLSGLPKHLVGSRAVHEAIEELVRDGWIVPSKKTRETHYSLNSRKVDEIRAYYETRKDSP